jgi:hypothetical protein
MIVGATLGSGGIDGDRTSARCDRGNADSTDPKESGEPDSFEGQFATAAA